MAGWPTKQAVKRSAKKLREVAAATHTYEDEAEIILIAAGLPQLVSHAEVRAILGTRNPRLPAGTPAPLYEDVGGRALWLREDIEAFAVEFQARPNVIARRQS